MIPLSNLKTGTKKAKETNLERPNAVALATADKRGIPSVRMLLYKGLKKGKFLIYTNYLGRKALEMDVNPNVALVFYWDGLHRQVRIEGLSEKIALKVSQEYFKTRPRGGQLAAWASPQDQPIPNREFLLQRFKEAEKRFEGKDDIPCPPFWGGYAITPLRFEFWEGRENRLHDRWLYKMERNRWKRERLAP